MPITTPDEELQAWLSFVDMLCLIGIYLREQRPEELIDRVGAIPGDVAMMLSLEPHGENDFPAFDRVRGIYDDLMAGESIVQRRELPIVKIIAGG